MVPGAGVLAQPVPHSAAFLPEEAVNEVKRQAMSELQKAVSDAERKAHELITTERAKMERALAEAKRQASEDALTVINQQEDSSEVGAGGDEPGGQGWWQHGCLGPAPFVIKFAASVHASVGTGGGCGNTTGWEEEGISCSKLGMGAHVPAWGAHSRMGEHSLGWRCMVQYGDAWSGMMCMVQDRVHGPGWRSTVWDGVRGPGWECMVRGGVHGLGCRCMV